MSTACTSRRSPVALVSHSASVRAFRRACSSERVSRYFGKWRADPSNTTFALAVPLRSLGLRRVFVSTAYIPGGPTKTWSMLKPSNGTSWKTRKPDARNWFNSSPTTRSPVKNTSETRQLWVANHRLDRGYHSTVSPGTGCAGVGGRGSSVGPDCCNLSNARVPAGAWARLMASRQTRSKARAFSNCGSCAALGASRMCRTPSCAQITGSFGPGDLPRSTETTIQSSFAITGTQTSSCVPGGNRSKM